MDQLILNHSLFIDKNYEEFINKFCSTTGSNFPPGKIGNYLGSWYEGYIFCLLIGLNTNNRHYNGFEKKYEKMSTWSTQNLNQYKYCLSRILSKQDIIVELGIDSRNNIMDNFTTTENLLKKTKEIADQFSLGGVHYLLNLYNDDVTIFDDSLSLVKIYKKTLNI